MTPVTPQQPQQPQTEAGRALLGIVSNGWTRDTNARDIAAIEAEARAAGKAAALAGLRAAVLDMNWAPDSDEDDETEWIDRAAVLRLIDEAMA